MNGALAQVEEGGTMGYPGIDLELGQFCYVFRYSHHKDNSMPCRRCLVHFEGGSSINREGGSFLVTSCITDLRSSLIEHIQQSSSVGKIQHLQYK